MLLFVGQQANLLVNANQIITLFQEAASFSAKKAGLSLAMRGGYGDALANMREEASGSKRMMNETWVQTELIHLLTQEIVGFHPLARPSVRLAGLAGYKLAEY